MIRIDLINDKAQKKAVMFIHVITASYPKNRLCANTLTDKESIPIHE